MAISDDDRHRDTKLVRGGTMRSDFGETSEALFLNSGFVYETAEEAAARFADTAPGYVYSRFANPTLSMLQDRLALLEGAQSCRVTASGMAAVFAALACQLQAGDRVVAARELFGSCHHIISHILPRFGIETRFVTGANLDEWREALQTPTQCVFFETPSNPLLSMVDIQAVCDLAHDAGACVIVDNVFASPFWQKPLDFGADIVMYSTTKHIDGHGRCLGGAILCTTEFVDNTLQSFLRHTGPIASPFNSWVMLKSLESLAPRIEKMTETAGILAQHLSEHSKLSRTIWPFLPSHPQYDLARKQMSGGSTLISFEFPDGMEQSFRFLNALRLIDISNNLGDAKSLITHPATTTHRALGEENRHLFGITDGLVRLSVGLEHVDDLWGDLRQALDVAFSR